MNRPAQNADLNLELPTRDTAEHSELAPPVPQGDLATAAFSPGDTVTTPIPRAPVGDRFGRYELVRLLGTGGMGDVHLAHDTLLERSVALKIPKFADDNPLHRQRFLREAKSAALLKHANICPVYDVGEVDGKPYLTMAFVDGPPLSSRLRQGPLDPHEAARLIAKVAHAMHHAHQNGIVHRDLKPANILLDSQGEPIVMDFGLAFRFDAETSDRLTEQGLVVGTPAYMPPEQINGQDLTPATDIYSLGVVLYELLTGKLPFEGTLGKLISQIESAAPPTLRGIRPEIDPALEAICLRALAKKPAQRFSDMAAFAEALEDYVKGKATLTHFAPPTQMFRRPRRYRVAVALGGLFAGVTATTIALAVLWLRRDLPIPEPPPDPQQIDIERQMSAMAKPILKVQYMFDDQPTTLSRDFLPASVLKNHPGPLYFMATGSGRDHVMDLTDQPGQAAQITTFGPGDITVRGTYLLFVGGLAEKTRVFIDGGPGYSILAPMNTGRGCQHVEFGGNHLLMPKLGDPVIETTDATPEERAKLRNRGLTFKVRWHYLNGADYTIYTWPTVKIVPGDHQQRQVDFPEIYNIIEFDRQRQNTATTVSNEVVRKALAEAKKQTN